MNQESYSTCNDCNNSRFYHYDMAGNCSFYNKITRRDSKSCNSGFDWKENNRSDNLWENAEAKEKI